MATKAHVEKFKQILVNQQQPLYRPNTDFSTGRLRDPNNSTLASMLNRTTNLAHGNITLSSIRETPFFNFIGLFLEEPVLKDIIDNKAHEHVDDTFEKHSEAFIEKLDDAHGALIAKYANMDPNGIIAAAQEDSDIKFEASLAHVVRKVARGQTFMLRPKANRKFVTEVQALAPAISMDQAYVGMETGLTVRQLTRSFAAAGAVGAPFSSGTTLALPVIMYAGARGTTFLTSMLGGRRFDNAFNDAKYLDGKFDQLREKNKLYHLDK